MINFERKKNVNIVALVDNTQFGIAAAEHGLALAGVFEASLILVRTKLLENMDEIKNHLISINPDIEIKEQTFKKIGDKSFIKFINESETAALVLAASKIKNEYVFWHKKVLKLILKLRVPSLVCGRKGGVQTDYKNIFLPIDSHQQTKEKVLWAGYFYRFYKSNIKVLTYNYSDEYLRNRIKHNFNFLIRLYSNLEVEYIHETLDFDKEFSIDEKAIQLAHDNNAGLILIMTTKYKNLFDYIYGVPELEILANDQNLPILCLNRRDDLYVLCT
ncbi:MAG: hypothetical protein ACOXZK_00985 [Bacteroidales bacterium]|jgi:hypothetical protein|nr:hypothetical protein [Bacteroidales bacterium]